MIQLIRNKTGDIIGYGNKNADIQFMLPNLPILLKSNQSIEEIIELNGNHWRKIFVIIAKLCCQQKQWQSYRKENLLHDVYLNFSLKADFKKKLTFVCGKQHAQAINIYNDSLLWETIDKSKLVKVKTNDKTNTIIIVPYLDYRQFPNALIEEVKRFYS